MNKWLGSRLFWGIILVLGGVIFLLENLDVIHIGDVFWALLVGLGSIFFFSIYFSDRLNWWALIPGFTLLSIAASIFLGFIAPEIADVWGGSIILGGIALGFLTIFLLNRQLWWAIIPAGVLSSISLAVGLSALRPSLETGGIVLIGIGITFAILSIIPVAEGRMIWAWAPAIVLLVIGFIITITSNRATVYLWPLALIAGGILLLFVTFRSRKRGLTR